MPDATEPARSAGVAALSVDMTFAVHMSIMDIVT